MAPGSARSLSQRVRSTSSAAELDQARRRITAARTKAAEAGRPGAPANSSRPITPRDVADRYDSQKGGGPAGRPAGNPADPTVGRPVRDSKESSGDVRGLSDQRGNLSRPSGSDQAASNAARIEAVRRDAAARSAAARTQAAREKAANASRDVRITNARIKQSAQDAKAASNNARIETARQQYANRVAAARRKSAVGAVGSTDGRGGRGNPSVIGNGRPIQAGNQAARGWNGGFNGGYGYGGYVDPYYNSCFWNYWGGNYSNGWCSFFWSPFYVTGLCWQNYWLYGGNWGGYYGWTPLRYRRNNCIWLGPFLPASTSFIVYDDPEPEIIYIEVPAEEQPVVGEVVVQPEYVEAAVPSTALPPEATDPGLQRELNRAAAYYLTQGDRAFREARFGDAAHFYAKAVEFSSDSGILYLVLSDALFATGDYRYAAYALRQAFDREPDLARNLVDKREFYADPAQFDRQLATLERYVEDHVLDMDARLVLSANYLFGGRPDAAWSLLENPFSEELRNTNEGKLIQSSAHRIMFGEEASSEERPATESGSSQF
ncbi:hypothetical protein Poly30_17420 [Planctomycetes bacterium Poly30]|uniref:Uncharacterized protein n=1 Tax=Saltatorellus ferox TaxID=2528018 RepID=A0A518EQ97_9BACT|nr:hypothetical protein Poly30_17420 [Planctomycetes bacterium Poly30]